ncbi:hypothetical protein PALI_b0709 [Pseudoalteromonas aliena SW19]|uniref:Uncharacterized protein n=1 Tax=Pseudoalteromonas aliena SW19 TaxID=1314866 RepID=A0ABR9E502_9GAMM|nr:hypothetical protein [Pseudoalteromonas aliena SW19]
MAYIPVRISKNRATKSKLPLGRTQGQRMFGIYAALSPIYGE